MHHHLSHINGPFVFPSRLLEDRLSPQRRFRDEQFWMAVKVTNSLKDVSDLNVVAFKCLQAVF